MWNHPRHVCSFMTTSSSGGRPKESLGPIIYGFTCNSQVPEAWATKATGHNQATTIAIYFNHQTIECLKKFTSFLP